eukprot:6102661-Amphidinium_carterae.1
MDSARPAEDEELQDMEAFLGDVSVLQQYAVSAMEIRHSHTHKLSLQQLTPSYQQRPRQVPMSSNQAFKICTDGHCPQCNRYGHEMMFGSSFCGMWEWDKHVLARSQDMKKPARMLNTNAPNSRDKFRDDFNSRRAMM